MILATSAESLGAPGGAPPLKAATQRTASPKSKGRHPTGRAPSIEADVVRVGLADCFDLDDDHDGDDTFLFSSADPIVDGFDSNAANGLDVAPEPWPPPGIETVTE